MPLTGLLIAVVPIVGDDILKIFCHKLVSDSMIGNLFQTFQDPYGISREKLKFNMAKKVTD